MPFATDPALAVLHVLRVRGITPGEEVAATAGLSVAETERLLAAAQASGYAIRREERLPGWALTREGRIEDGELVRAELRESGAGPAVEDAYHAFLALNPELLGLCTDWQLFPVVGKEPPLLNDHSDAAYDAAVVKRLGVVDDAAQPICADLGAALSRFARYGPRLAAARAHVEQGDGDWLAKPMMDSYHSVWFELHEDLLATLGIERGSEPT